MQQGPPGGDEAQQKALEAYEQMLNTFENNAKDFWGMWGAPGESMVQGIEASVRMQRACLQLLRQASGAGGNGT
jgi:hypothetical protein